MWKQTDIDWLELYYPDIKLVESNKFSGPLSFSMLRRDGRWIVGPSEAEIDDTAPHDYLSIQDTYQISITWPENEKFPRAHELGGRLAEVARQKGKKLLDMHQYEADKALCLSTPMDLELAFEDGFSMEVFVQDLLVPYLFAQSHYAQSDEWLWGEHSHGYLGLVEWLGRRDEPTAQEIADTYKWLFEYNDKNEAHALLSRRCRGHQPCLCGSSIKLRNCHPEIQRGVMLLRDHMLSSAN